MPLNYLVSPDLEWTASDNFSKMISIQNTGTESFSVEVPGPTNFGNDFYKWSPQRRATVPVAASSTHSSVLNAVSVMPPIPRNGLGLVTDTVHLRIFDVNGNLAEDYQVHCRNNATGKIQYGDVAISAFVYNPLGNDVAPEGEFIELGNLTGHALDFEGSYLSQIQFRASDGRAGEQRLAPFKRDITRNDFGAACLLAAGATLRVLTRKQLPADGGVAANTNRFYLGFTNPIWNNTGDRATLYNEFDQKIVSSGYLSQADSPVSGPLPPRVYAQFSVEIAGNNNDWQDVFTLEDGDAVEITADDDVIANQFLVDGTILPGTIGMWTGSPAYLPSGRRLLILPRRIGAAEPAPVNSDPDDQFILAGAPKGALLGRIGIGGTPFAIGAGLSSRMPITLNAPSQLSLYINDSAKWFWDNSGSFIVHVTIWR